MPPRSADKGKLPFQPKRSWTEPLMSAEYLRVALELAAEKGLDTSELLAQSGLKASELDDLDARISHLAYGLVVHQLAELSHDQGVGFEIGLRIGPTAHGALGHAMMCSETLQQALDLFNRYGLTRLAGLQFQVKPQGRYLTLTLDRDWEALETYTKIFLEGTLAGMYRVVQILTGEQNPPVEISLMHAEPDYFVRFRDRMPPVKFGQAQVSVRLPAELLQRRLIMPSPTGLRLALLRCEEEAATVSLHLANWTSRVQNLLRPGPYGYPTLIEMAAKLSVSDRTLKRKLAEEGCQFKEMLRETRRRDALTLLSNKTLGIEQIATRLGYQNPANFTRAFGVWTGQSPSAYRKAQSSTLVD